MQGAREPTLDEMQRAANKAAPNPDRYLSAAAEDRPRKLVAWAQAATSRLGPGALAAAPSSPERLGRPVAGLTARQPR
jgi:hypothetical protein